MLKKKKYSFLASSRKEEREEYRKEGRVMKHKNS
jgi:hypothetical protein